MKQEAGLREKMKMKDKLMNIKTQKTDKNIRHCLKDN